MDSTRRERPWLLWISAAFSSAFAVAAILARGPDFLVEFDRFFPWETENSFSKSRVWVENPQRWPAWFHSGLKAQWSGLSPRGEILPGSEARIWLDPKRSTFKRVEILIQISEIRFEKNQTVLAYRLLGDSKGKIQKQFEPCLVRLEWSPRGIRAHAQAQTKTWRARLTSRVSSRAVMNQLFHPHLFRFVKLVDGRQDELIEGKQALYSQKAKSDFEFRDSPRAHQKPVGLGVTRLLIAGRWKGMVAESLSIWRDRTPVFPTL